MLINYTTFVRLSKAYQKLQLIEIVRAIYVVDKKGNKAIIKDTGSR